MILITGVAGFIGTHLALRLLDEGQQVTGVDCFGIGHSKRAEAMKHARLALLQGRRGFALAELDITDTQALDALFGSRRIRTVVHLAARTGVRESAHDPHAYVMSNVVGFSNLLQHCQRQEVEHVLYASSSSIYGVNAALPYSEHQPASHPVSVYAATKRSKELLAHAYSYLHGLPTTGLRFFTVYGPWGRPDMAPMLFADAIAHDKTLTLYDCGRMRRDFTYVDDVVDAIVRLLPPAAGARASFDAACPDPAISSAPWRVFNVGNQQPLDVLSFVDELEQAFGRSARRELLRAPPGEMPATWADSSALADATGWRARTSLQAGVQRFVQWYRQHHD